MNHKLKKSTYGFNTQNSTVSRINMSFLGLENLIKKIKVTILTLLKFYLSIYTSNSL